jgi:hypothetical protein
MDSLPEVNPIMKNWAILRVLYVAVVLSTCGIAPGEVPAPAATGTAANPTSDAYETMLRTNAARVVEKEAPKNDKFGTTFFESEKAAYPRAFFGYLAGNREAALKYLQSEDADAKRWHEHTLGIDLFPSFTLKGQTRKYFQFKSEMEPAYVKRMFDAARIWTEQDPLHRPHPAYKGPKEKEDWTPERNDSWVDSRTTDNLTFMRDSAVYLFAEETGNEATRQRYKRHLLEHVKQMYDVGMGEWDSKNYLSHSFSPWLNIYDFAKDAEVRLAAKGALDWISAAAAVKYWRGGWQGPTKRENWRAEAWQINSAVFFAYYFDEIDNPNPSHEEAWAILSGYRPPPAVVELARKNFARPVLLQMAKPPYEGYDSKPSHEVNQPRFRETQYIGESFMIGSLPDGNLSDSHVDDVNGFSIMSRNNSRGVDYVIIGTGVTDPGRTVSSGNGKDHLVQTGSRVVWTNADPNVVFTLQLPMSATIDEPAGPAPIANSRRVIRLEGCEIILTLTRAEWKGVDEAQTRQLAEKRKMTADQIATIVGTGVGPASIDILVVEPGKQPSSAFKEPPPQQDDPYFVVPGSASAPIRQGWKKGEIVVEAGGKKFTGRVDEQGRYQFSND